ncbi:retrovirus-related pol polyprotein from transposon TNT 1-94 [Tanacetum coccineum]
MEKYIMKSITEGPFQMGMVIQTVAEETEGALQLGPERARVFTDLTAEEKERYKANIRATNILLQGIPKTSYFIIINHYTDAKDIWDNVKIILEGSELTKDDKESQLYDEFERFLQIKGETIHVYYVRFITEVKLNKGLKESNFYQLHAYLKQHEVHANENKMMMERFIQPTNDPLALVSNVSIRFSRKIQHSHPCLNPQKSQTQSPARNNARGNAGGGNAGGQNRFRNVNPSQAKPIKCYNCNGLGHIARECPRPKRPQDSNYFKDKMLLMQAQENEQDLVLNVDHVFEADQLDAFDSDVDEAPTTHTMFMANLTSEDPIFNEAGTSYDSDIPFEVQDHDNYHDSVYGHHDVHEMQNNIQQDYVVDSES